MLASLLRSWIAPVSSTARRDDPRLCVPEWSEPMAEQQSAIWWKVKPYTMTSVERVVALCQSIAYLENNGVPGAIAECGVWKGGSMMAAALALRALESTQRQLYLFDTFAGMTEPELVDVNWRGQPARDLLRRRDAEGELIRARCSLAEVKQALLLTGYPWEKFIFVEGAVETTIPENAPEQIALLRLATGWHASTQHSLEQLFPRLADGGILIVDDYGHWQGARKAVDIYFRRHGIDPELRTIDFMGRLLVKKSPRLALAAVA